MKSFFLIICTFSYLTMNSQTVRDKFYFFTFGCCFENDSIIVKDEKKIFFSRNVFTDPSTGIDNENIFEVSKNLPNKFFNVMMPKANKSIQINLQDTLSNTFLYIYFYKDSLFYNVSKKLLNGM